MNPLARYSVAGALGGGVFCVAALGIELSLVGALVGAVGVFGAVLLATLPSKAEEPKPIHASSSEALEAFREARRACEHIKVTARSLPRKVLREDILGTLATAEHVLERLVQTPERVHHYQGFFSMIRLFSSIVDKYEAMNVSSPDDEQHIVTTLERLHETLRKLATYFGEQKKALIENRSSGLNAELAVAEEALLLEGVFENSSHQKSSKGEGT